MLMLTLRVPLLLMGTVMLTMLMSGPELVKTFLHELVGQVVAGDDTLQLY
jgi:hypothetical protein